MMDADSGGSDYGDSFIRLSPNGTVQDYFSPSVQTTLDNGNFDLGSGGVLLLPDQSGAHPHECSAPEDTSVYPSTATHGYPAAATVVQIVTSIFGNDLPRHLQLTRPPAPATRVRRQPRPDLRAQQRPPHHHADLENRPDLQRARRHDGDLREWQQQRHPLDTPNQRSRRARNPPRLQRNLSDQELYNSNQAAPATPSTNGTNSAPPSSQTGKSSSPQPPN